jgi:hypothetical protein
MPYGQIIDSVEHTIDWSTGSLKDTLLACQKDLNDRTSYPSGQPLQNVLWCLAIGDAHQNERLDFSRAREAWGQHYLDPEVSANVWLDETTSNSIPRHNTISNSRETSVTVRRDSGLDTEEHYQRGEPETLFNLQRQYDNFAERVRNRTNYIRT